ncbi:MAG: hypothetical protein IT279_09110 [Ignavibacteriaceae bacterium]|nr:hypothetical protein [Ignavibacteriaceae bacterium]
MKLYSKILIFLTSITGVTWLGAYIARLFVTYSFFVPPTLNLRPEFQNTNLTGVFVNLIPLVNLTTVAFLGFIILFGLTLLVTRPNLRKNGWLFISLATVIITAPFEIYSIVTFDSAYFTAGISGQFDSSLLLNNLIKRLDKLSGFPVIQICCYGAIIFMAIYKPLVKNEFTDEN